MSDDRTKLWFEVLTQLGEDSRSSYALFSLTQQDEDNLNWYQFPHEDSDGFGGVFRLGETLGFKPEEIQYHIGKSHRPSFFQKIKALISYHPESKLRHTNWKEFDRRKEGTPYKSCIFFSPEVVKEIQTKALREGVKPYFYILKRIDEYISKNLMNEEGERWWMFPVNMRTTQSKYSGKNHSSYISLQLTDYISLSQIKDQFVLKLKNYTHWAAWFWMKLFQRMGRKAVENALNYYDSNDHGWAGTFSFLEYNMANEKFKDDILFGVAPVTRAHPFSCDLFKVNDHLVLGLKSHQGMFKSGDEFINFKNQLKKYIQS